MAETWDWELLAGPATITEGPAWDGAGLFYTSIADNEIRRYDPATGEIVTVYRDTGGIERSGARSRRVALRLRGNGTSRRPLRDRRCEDDAGRPLRGSPSQQPQRSRARSRRSHLVHRPSLWRRPQRPRARPRLGLPHHSSRRWGGDVGDRAPDLRYHAPERVAALLGRADAVPRAERLRPRDRCASCAPTRSGTDGTLGEFTVLHDFGEARGIDGMCWDADGNIVATCGWERSGPGPRIAVFATDGTVLEEHLLPTAGGPTNCAFGGTNLDDPLRHHPRRPALPGAEHGTTRVSGTAVPTAVYRPP